MDMMLEGCKAEDREQLAQELTGPFRTMGNKIAPEDIDAPAWWHGDEEAFEVAQVATMMRRPGRRR